MPNVISFGTRLPGVTYTVRPGVYGVVLRPDLQQVAVIRTSQGDFLPGGGIEDGETHEQCLQREGIEEIGWLIEPGPFIGTAQKYHFSTVESQHYLLVGHFYLARLVQKVAEPSEDDHELQWINVEDLAALLVHEHQVWAVEQAIRSLDVRPGHAARAGRAQMDS